MARNKPAATHANVKFVSVRSRHTGVASAGLSGNGSGMLVSVLWFDDTAGYRRPLGDVREIMPWPAEGVPVCVLESLAIEHILSMGYEPLLAVAG